MSRIIKEPFPPRRRHPMIHYRRELSRVTLFSCRLQRSVIALRQLANAYHEEICMAVLSISLLVTTLLLPWIVL
jgi:hypothetical protein